MSKENLEATLSEKNLGDTLPVKLSMKDIDGDYLSFLKLCLFQDIIPEYENLEEAFLKYTSEYIEVGRKNSFFTLNSVIFPSYFKVNFSEHIQKEINSLRYKWLISHCKAMDLFGLNAKESQNYFKDFEVQSAENYLGNLVSIERWMKSSFLKVRFALLSLYIKKNFYFISIFLIVFAFTVYFSFFSDKNEVNVILEQVKNWTHFVLGKI